MSKQIERQHAERINRELFHCRNYLGRLHARMVQVGLLWNDPLLQKVRQARDAVFSLRVELHYLSCASGVGRPLDGDEHPKT